MIFGALQGLIIPWVAGFLIVTWLGASRERSIWNYAAGWLTGQLLVAAMMYLQSALLGRINVTVILFVLVALIIQLNILIARRSMALVVNQKSVGYDRATQAVIGSPIRNDSLPQSAASLFTVALITMIVLTLARYIAFVYSAEIPIRADDAYTIWLYKAKVITGLGTLPLDPAAPSYQAGSFTHYPPLIPLIAAWLPLCAGQWSEPLVAITWILFHLSLIGVVGGATLSIGSHRSAIVAAYLVGSIPLVCVHVFRPGYADLPLACFLAATVGSLLQWLHARRPIDFILATVFATATACCKREGVGPAVITIVCFIAAGFPILRACSVRYRISMCAALAIAAFVTVAIVDLSDQRRAMTSIVYHPEAWPALRRHLFDWLSFGPAFVIAAILLIISPWMIARTHGSQRRRVMLASSITVLLVGFVCSIFLLTVDVRFALNDQTPSRLFLQVLPAIMLTWIAATIKEPIAQAIDDSKR